MSPAGALPASHEVALAVGEVGREAHGADGHLLADRCTSVALDGDQGGVDVVHLQDTPQA
jgi:hypothetical protein